MKFHEFNGLVEYIAKYNTSRNVQYGRPGVRYLDPVIDMRSMEVFAVDIRCTTIDVSFSVVNEARTNPLSLEQRIREFLDTAVDSYIPEKDRKKCNDSIQEVDQAGKISEWKVLV